MNVSVLCARNLAVVGSRSCVNYQRIDQGIREWISTYGWPTMIISGGAPGVDTLAEQWAATHKVPCKIYPVNWSEREKSTEPTHSNLIIEASTHVLAFPRKKSRVTLDVIHRAEAAGKIVTVYSL